MQAACRAAIEAGLVRSRPRLCRGRPGGGAGGGLRHRAAADRGGRSSSARRRPRATSCSSARRRRVSSSRCAPETRSALRADHAGVRACPWRWIGRVGGDRLEVRVGVAVACRWRSTGAVDADGCTALEEPALSDMSAGDERALELDDKFHDECGLFGVWDHPEAANVAYLGLYALQHRGQESAGIAATDGHAFHVEKAMGWVADVFSPRAPPAPARATAPSATCATRRRAARSSGTPSRSRATTARGPDRASPTTATWSTPRRSGEELEARRRDLPVHLGHRGDPPPARARRPAAPLDGPARRRRSPRSRAPTRCSS